MTSNKYLIQILEKGYTTDQDGVEIKVDSAISLDDAQSIESVIKRYGCQTAVEVGCAYGTSAMLISESLDNSANKMHYILDPHQFHSRGDNLNGGHGFDGIGYLNLCRSGYKDTVRLIDKPSFAGLPILINENIKVDFAFIDGWHTFDYTLVDIFLIDKILKVGGIMLIDDTTITPVRKACSFLIKNLNYEVIRLNGTNRPRNIFRQTFNSMYESFLNNKKFGFYYSADYPGSDVWSFCNSDMLFLIKKGEDDRIWNHFERF